MSFPRYQSDNRMPYRNTRPPPVNQLPGFVNRTPHQPVHRVSPTGLNHQTNNFQSQSNIYPTGENSFHMPTEQRPPLPYGGNQEQKNLMQPPISVLRIPPPAPPPPIFSAPPSDEKPMLFKNMCRPTESTPFQNNLGILPPGNDEKNNFPASRLRYPNPVLNSSPVFAGKDIQFCNFPPNPAIRSQGNHMTPLPNTGNPTPPQFVTLVPAAASHVALQPNLGARIQLPNNRMMHPVPNQVIRLNVPPPPIAPQLISNMSLPIPPKTDEHTPIRLPVNITQPPPFPPLHQPVIAPPLLRPTSLPRPGNPVKDLKAEYKETMVNIVKTWIQSRDSFSLKKSKDKELMKIHKFRENLIVFVGLIEKLRALNDSLAEYMEADKDVWDELMEDVMKTKNDVINLQYKLFNPEQMKFITTEQKNRKKKRNRMKLQKKVRNETYLSSLSKRIQLNEEIDEALQKERTKIAMEKRDESLKNTAGESLTEVKRKQSEVSQFKDVFNLLKQLREIRKKTAIYQGIFVTEKDDDKFSSQIDIASKLLTDNAKVYENEERTLRALREEEAQEMDRLEKEKRKKRKENREEQLTQVDPMFPFRLYWLQGEESIEGLVHVRRMWDISLCPPGTPGGTRIPKSFVEPCKPCDKEWAKYLVKKPKVRKRKSDFGTSA